MLEALIERTNGNVLVVAPANKVWGEFEKTYFRVVQWQDESLEPVTDALSDPYTIYNDDWEPIGVSKWVDVSSVDLSGTATLSWSLVSPAVRTA